MYVMITIYSSVVRISVPFTLNRRLLRIRQAGNVTPRANFHVNVETAVDARIRDLAQPPNRRKNFAMLIRELAGQLAVNLNLAD
jgi:hypothetical protein